MSSMHLESTLMFNKCSCTCIFIFELHVFVLSLAKTNLKFKLSGWIDSLMRAILLHFYKFANSHFEYLLKGKYIIMMCSYLKRKYS